MARRDDRDQIRRERDAGQRDRRDGRERKGPQEMLEHGFLPDAENDVARRRPPSAMREVFVIDTQILINWYDEYLFARPSVVGKGFDGREIGAIPRVRRLTRPSDNP
ncbi:hypothetical protein GCM10011390_16190 [Aureimonas endophytica]|uniref:Uncharacterized protein n=1 Tax=Aureimonas endophytica TaxID=2027858 RepID=A0A916ZHG2_9HYPH|nr:hypothetical protein GCM10011390_16190 [Aureimonas endophytica]